MREMVDGGGLTALGLWSECVLCPWGPQCVAGLDRRGRRTTPESTASSCGIRPSDAVKRPACSRVPKDVAKVSGPVVCAPVASWLNGIYWE